MQGLANLFSPLTDLLSPNNINRIFYPNKTFRRGPIGWNPQKERPMRRMVYLGNNVSVWGWPSRGGLIVLERVTPIDIDFLGIDPVNPPLDRDADQDAEDQLCQRLLLLGAKWFDSLQRYQFVAGVNEDDERFVDALMTGKVERLTSMERRWVCVGYPGGDGGTRGLWVAEFDTPLPFIEDKDNLEPDDAAKVMIAKTMDERCEILKGMGAKFFETVEQYQGTACLRAWENRTTGEHGPLLPTRYPPDGV